MEPAHSPGRMGGPLIDSRLCTVSKETLGFLAVPFLNYLEKLLVSWLVVEFTGP